jgi:pentatricopeptide repeat protein
MTLLWILVIHLCLRAGMLDEVMQTVDLILNREARP